MAWGLMFSLLFTPNIEEETAINMNNDIKYDLILSSA